MAYELYFTKSSLSGNGIMGIALGVVLGVGQIIRMPVAPEKIKTKVNGRNETVELMNYGEYNILNSPGLTDIDFELELPSSTRPYAAYPTGFKTPQYYLSILEDLITSKQPFKFILIRVKPDGTPMHDTNMLVSLEEYTITDDVDEGTDVIVSIRLKQYKKAETVVVKLKQSTGGGTVTAKADNKATSSIKSYTVKTGDNLWNICKKILGDGSKCYEVAKHNKIKDADKIYAGQVIKFP